ncbi:tyrosine-protein kinase RYK-like isoform X2 [Varroa destructor]|uniref:Tyrosine-protein kinase RYK n=1 Tax=Varroa destructor TaxID=109461 RepID=A0A7M7M517_VARDE|nr:tyrosine-protein kinase RYK-like isoform X2 [Varroa destructor]
MVRWRLQSLAKMLWVNLLLFELCYSNAITAVSKKHPTKTSENPIVLELKPPPNGPKKTQIIHGLHRSSQSRNERPFSFDLFLEKEESKRLLGIDVNLFYVRDGVTNEYALRFPVPVPGNMSELEFSWKNLRPQHQTLNYKIEIQLDNPHAMFQPTLNIPSKVPDHAESFVVRLHCTGRSNAEVRVTILVDISRANEAKLGDKDDVKEASQQIKLQRKKVCLQDEKSVTTTARAVIDGIDGEVEASDEDEGDEEELEENSVILVGDSASDKEASRRKKNSANSVTMISDEALAPGNDWGNAWGANGWPVLLVAGAGAVATGAALASLLATAVCFMRNQKNKRQNASTTLTSSSKPAGQQVIQAAAEKYCREWVAASTLNGSIYGHGIGQGTEVTSMLTTATPSMHIDRTLNHRLIRLGSPVASTIASYSSFRKARHLEVPPSPAPPPTMGGLNQLTLKCMGTLNSSAGQYSTIQDLSRSRSSLLSEQLAELAIDMRYLSLVKLLSEGSFGRVYHAVLNDPSCPPQEAPSQAHSVLVKTVTNQATSEQVEQFMQEGMMLFGMNHANVMQVVGTCLDLASQPALIYPAMGEGNLKQFLRQNALLQTDCGKNRISPQDLVDMGVQVAEGLMYLHRRFFLHKDVATRNCMLDERLHVKLGDNSLSRDLFPDDYHCLGDGEHRPVAWLAIESLQNREFTPASDLWMFGVTIWELLTLGQQPFPDVDPADMGVHLRSGHRLPQPSNAPDEMYSLMCRCWCLCPGDRVTLQQATRTLADFHLRFDSSSSGDSRDEVTGSREALTSSRRPNQQHSLQPHMQNLSARQATSTVGSTSSFKPNAAPAVYRDDEVIYANDVLP